MTTTDRLPSTASELAHLMIQLDEQAKPGAPDPSLSLWDRLSEQEGYGTAAPLWRDAYAYYDYLMSDAEE